VHPRFAEHDDIRLEVVHLSRVGPEGISPAEAALGGWCRLLNEAASWREIPPSLAGNPALEAAMKALNEFRVDHHLNTLYRGRLEYERVRKAELGELEDTRAALAAALERAEAERAQRERAEEKVEAERAQRERAEEKAEAERVQRERAEEKVEAEGVQRERAEEKVEAEGVQRERAEAENQSLRALLAALQGTTVKSTPDN
jgi:hypothetical protein